MCTLYVILLVWYELYMLIIPNVLVVWFGPDLLITAEQQLGLEESFIYNSRELDELKTDWVAAEFYWSVIESRGSIFFLLSMGMSLINCCSNLADLSCVALSSSMWRLPPRFVLPDRVHPKQDGTHVVSEVQSPCSPHTGGENNTFSMLINQKCYSSVSGRAGCQWEDCRLRARPVLMTLAFCVSFESNCLKITLCYKKTTFRLIHM